MQYQLLWQQLCLHVILRKIGSNSLQWCKCVSELSELNEQYDVDVLAWCLLKPRCCQNSALS